MTSIKIDDVKNTEDIEKALRKKVGKEIQVELIGNLDKLKENAQFFIDKMDAIANEYEILLKKNGVIPKSQITALYQAMRDEEKYVQEALSYQHDFEEQLNAFMGRIIDLVYVKEDGSLLYETSALVKEWYEAAGVQYGRGNLSSGKINELEEKLGKTKDKFIANIQKLLNNAADARKLVYSTAVERYKDSEMDYKKENNNALMRSYWWQAKDHKTTGHINFTGVINNVGDIAEGFAGAVINSDPNITNNDIEGGLEVLWAQHIRRNSTPAIIQGDVIYSPLGMQMQFAIKSGSFSTARLGQYYRFAKNIVQLEMPISPELLEKRPDVFRRLTQSGKAAKAIVQAINAGEDIDEAVKRAVGKNAA